MWISRAFKPEVLNLLESLARLTGTVDTFRKLKELANHAKKNLRQRFNQEILDNHSYYAMYDLNYFKEQADIEECDCRIYTDGMFGIFETMISNHIKYTINNLPQTVAEIEQDLNDHARTFFGAIYREYQEYVSEIEKLLDEIGADLPKQKEEEKVADYLKRMCVIMAR
jgi:hypothetical protein